jgi:hypothetical protein
MKIQPSFIRLVAWIAFSLLTACDQNVSVTSKGNSGQNDRLLKHLGARELVITTNATKNARYYQIAVLRFQEGKLIGSFFIHPGVLDNPQDRNIQSSFIWHLNEGGTVRTSMATNGMVQERDSAGDWWKFDATTTMSKAPAAFHFDEYAVGGFAAETPTPFFDSFQDVLKKSKKVVALAIRYTDSEATAKVWSENAHLVYEK